MRRVGYVVWVCGELHDAAAEALAGSIRDLVDRGAREVILDLTSVGTVDLAAVDALAATARMLADLDGWLLLTERRTDGDGYAVKKVEPRRLSSMLGIHDELDQAICRQIVERESNVLR